MELVRAISDVAVAALALDTEILAANVVDALARHLPGAGFALALTGEGNPPSVWIVASAGGADAGRPAAAETPLSWHTSAESLARSPALARAVALGQPQLAQDGGHAVLYAPFSALAEPVGVLVIAFAGEPPPGALDLAAQAARIVGPALHNARAHTRLHRRAAPPAAEEARRDRVLVIEDDDAVRAALSDLLAPRFDVVTAVDSESGLRMARQTRPDLVLLDLYLPGMDGLCVLSELRAEPATEEIPVLLLSAASDVPTKVRGLALGAVDYLTKPFSAQELLARVERTLRLCAQREHYRALAQTDALTGLPNFRALRARLDEEARRARRYGTELAVVMVDLDGLKQINDTLGHAAGNRAIATIADVVRAELRDTDFAARYGGDEFVVLLPHTGARDASRFAERVRRALHAQPQATRASFGVAALDKAGEAEDLLKAADRALYQAKRQGGDAIGVV